MQTQIQKAIEDIKGYKAFGKTIDIDFVVTLLNTYYKEKKQDMKQTSVDWLFENLWDEPKDKLTWHSILDKAKEMAQLPQQEISDEEIEKFADEELGTIRSDFDMGVIQGMKLYREQLKQKQ